MMMKLEYAVGIERWEHAMTERVPWR